MPGHPTETTRSVRHRAARLRVAVRRVAGSVLLRAGIRRVTTVARPTAALVAALVARVLRQLTVLGWSAALLGGAAVLLGARFGWVELTSSGAALLAAVTVGAVQLVGRASYRVVLDMTDQRVPVGGLAVGRVTVSSGRRRQGASTLELTVGRNTATIAVGALARGQQHEEVFTIPTTHRDVITVGPVSSVRGDAIGLARRTVRWTGTTELYVHPRILPLAGGVPGSLRDMEGQAAAVLSDSDMSFHALREYVPGDDKRQIHWRSTARIGTLMVRQFEDTRRTSTALALSTAAADYRSDADLELAVSVVASIGVQSLRDGRDVTVILGDTAASTATAAGLLDSCSAVRTSPDGAPATSLALAVAGGASSASIALLVTGGAVDLATARATLRHIPPSMRCVIVGCAAGAPLEVTAQGRVASARLGELDDLRRLLRQVLAP